MKDGTYLVDLNNQTIENYGDRWNYGYFVAGPNGLVTPENVFTADDLFTIATDTGSSLIGVWRADLLGVPVVYVDPVVHAADRQSAFELAVMGEQISVYDAFLQEVILTEDL